MRFIVQKFGGTSLASSESREKVADKIIEAREEGYSPVIVVSAMGRDGDPYATDTLLGLARKNFQELPQRELDLLMSCGETISGVVMTAILQQRGYPAVFLTGPQAGIVTNTNFGEAKIEKIKPQSVVNHSGEGNIVVVAGFQGITEDGEITTLGRGGSDTTAAALGVALDATYVDIYTDVDGIKTADPGVVEEARTLDRITYDEICHLAHEGAKVIHPRAVEIASQKNIPIRIRSTFSDGKGTLVTNSSELYRGSIDITRDSIITGITHNTEISQFKIITGNGAEAFEQQSRLFNAVALAGISIVFINVVDNTVLFTVKNQFTDKTQKVLENTGYAPEILKDCAKVSVVGAAMTGVPGIISNIVEALTEEQVQILQCNDSHTTVWVLVNKEDLKKAVKALHRKFLLDEQAKSS